ncbi:MAG: DUF6077 domain-containing protein [Candidatus Omnitrophica bacterium]|nr:DUF6077 domain-containing protein [Candidatus Omnitrophota bacterium]MDD5488757.1 DUF6077 domain-containing protein [Candidatus Omnitrophota bacterium]
MINMYSIEILLMVFSSWTLAYHLALFRGTPVYGILLPFVVFLVVNLLGFTRRGVLKGEFSRAYACSRNEEGPNKKIFYAFLCLSVLTGIFVLVSLRPDADDLIYIRRVIMQIQNPASAIMITDTIHLPVGLPPISYLHVMTSYEYFLGMLSYFSGADLLAMYYNYAPFLLGLLIPLVYFSIYRTLRLGRAMALASTVGVLCFLVVDGALHNSFGSHALVRIWQGKTVLMAFLVPVALWAGLRFFARPSGRYFYMLFMIGISSVGLTGSGLILIPIYYAGLSVSYLLNGGVNGKRLKKAVFPLLAAAYPAVISAAFVLHMLPMPLESTFTQKGAVGWWEVLSEVVNGKLELLRDVTVLFILPFIVLKKRQARSIAGLSAALVLIFANPVSMRAWISVVDPGVLWRVFYLFPLPLCSGLLAAAVYKCWIKDRDYLSFRSVAILLITLIFVFSFDKSAISGFKAPWEYQLTKREAAFSEEAGDLVRGRYILAPWDIVSVQGLLNTDSRYETHWMGGTRLVFLNSGDLAEGYRRYLAQEFITSDAPAPLMAAAFAQSIRNGVDCVIMDESRLGRVANVIDIRNGEWSAPLRKNGYVLLLKKK